MPPVATTTVAASAVLSPIASSSHHVTAAVRAFHSGDVGGGGGFGDAANGGANDGGNIAGGLAAVASAAYSFDARAAVADLLTASQQKNYSSYETAETPNYDGLSPSSSSLLSMAPTLNSGVEIEDFFNGSTSLLNSASVTFLDGFMNGSRNSTSDGDDDGTPPNNYWGLLALVLVACTAAGNILVCLAITHERRLQNITNYFLMSLAITDLMVAILVMPLGILTLVKGECENGTTRTMVLLYQYWKLLCL